MNIRKCCRKLGLSVKDVGKPLTPEILIKIEQHLSKPNKDREKIIARATKEKLNSDDPKYVCMIGFLNDVLTLLGKERIRTVNEFKDIARNDLMKPECVELAKDRMLELCSVFGKKQLRFDRMHTIKSVVISLIKYMTTEIGHNFVSSRIDKTIVIDTNQYKKVYSIVYCITS